MSNHLQHIGDRVILVRVDLAVVVLCIHDDDLVGGEVEAPGEVARHDHNLDGAGRKQLFNKFTLDLSEALVEVRNAVTDRLLQGLDRDVTTHHRKQVRKP